MWERMNILVEGIFTHSGCESICEQVPFTTAIFLRFSLSSLIRNYGWRRCHEGKRGLDAHYPTSLRLHVIATKRRKRILSLEASGFRVGGRLGHSYCGFKVWNGKDLCTGLLNLQNECKEIRFARRTIPKMQLRPQTCISEVGIFVKWSSWIFSRIRAVSIFFWERFDDIFQKAIKNAQEAAAHLCHFPKVSFQRFRIPSFFEVSAESTTGPVHPPQLWTQNQPGPGPPVSFVAYTSLDSDLCPFLSQPLVFQTDAGLSLTWKTGLGLWSDRWSRFVHCSQLWKLDHWLLNFFNSVKVQGTMPFWMTPKSVCETEISEIVCQVNKCMWTWTVKVKRWCIRFTWVWIHKSVSGWTEIGQPVIRPHQPLHQCWISSSHQQR